MEWNVEYNTLRVFGIECSEPMLEVDGEKLTIKGGTPDDPLPKELLLVNDYELKQGEDYNL